MEKILSWLFFNLFILGLLLLDLGVFHKKSHEIKIKEATLWSLFWISLALAFNGLIFWWKGSLAATEFFTAFVVEKSLSVDNIFVIILIFSYFKVPKIFQHKVLFWGILGALIMRAFFIVSGVALLNRFHFIFYLFGIFLIYTGIKMALPKKEEIEEDKNFLISFIKKHLPIVKDPESGKFFTRDKKGKRAVTQLFLTLVFIETTDLIFAVDSIPAVLGISQDSFIVYTSNVFAILGLRSLFFLVSGVLGLFTYLQYGLSAILVFVGIKMLISDYYTISSSHSLLVILGCLTLSIIPSFIFPKKSATETKKELLS